MIPQISIECKKINVISPGSQIVARIYQAGRIPEPISKKDEAYSMVHEWTFQSDSIVALEFISLNPPQNQNSEQKADRLFNS